MADLADSGHCEQQRVQFYCQDAGQGPRLRQAILPGHGSLGPVFHAFGLISQQEMEAGVGSLSPGMSSKACTIWSQLCVAEPPTCGGLIHQHASRQEAEGLLHVVMLHGFATCRAPDVSLG